MPHRNYILFIALSLATLIGWQTLVLPRLMPPRPRAVAKRAEKPNLPKSDESSAKTARGEAGQPGKDRPAKVAATPAKAAKATEKKTAAEGVPDDKRPPAYKPRTIVLGSSDPKTGYFLRAEMTSKGAAVASIEFNDPRYRDLKDAKAPLKIVGTGADARLFQALQERDAAQREHEVAAERLKAALAAAPGARESDREGSALKTAEDNLRRAERNVHLAQLTFNTGVPEVDARLVEGPTSVAGRDWLVDDADIIRDPVEAGVNSAVTFHYASPDGELILEKRYSLEKVTGGGAGDGASREARDVRDAESKGYLLHLEITLKNVGARERAATYVLQGPVGLPLENADNTRKFRDLKMGFLTPAGAVTAESVTVSKLITDEEKNRLEEWKTPLKYIGDDVQYFTALVVPVDDQLQRQTIERSIPMLLDRPREKQHADLSVQLESRKVVLAPKEAVTDRFDLFVGPKRKALLAPLAAEGILDSSWISPPIVSDSMLLLLNFLHRVGIPYGIAIICLTILVRACLFPVTLRMTAQAQRMKDMQPKLQEIRKKYANDKEKLAMANLELMRQYKVNPLGGCLPLLLQLPIFTGLWMALNNSVDLRRAPFLYFDNLAAPDALFHLPFVVPILGWTEFNLLPIVAVALMVVQQKMFMPPPADEQQEMQYKMMNVMMVVMGVTFYRVPAGLCVYFISSSLWGLGERKLLEWRKARQPQAPVAPTPTEEAPRKSAKPADGPSGLRGGAAGSLWKKLLNAADAAGAEASSGSKTSISRRSPPSGKKAGKRAR